MYEEDVVAAVAGFLEEHGYTILRRARTTQHGTDLIAGRSANPEQTIHVEAKGETSSRLGSARYGMTFDANQAFSHVAKAVHAAMRFVSTAGPGDQAAIALPRNSQHEKYVQPIQPALRRCGIAIFWVGSDMSVSFEGDWRL